jgi:excisionase family DNA binding protein
VDELLTLQEVSQILKMHLETVREMARTGEIPAFKINKRGDYRVRRSDLDKWIEEKLRNRDGEQ